MNFLIFLLIVVFCTVAEVCVYYAARRESKMSKLQAILVATGYSLMLAALFMFWLNTPLFLILLTFAISVCLLAMSLLAHSSK